MPRRGGVPKREVIADPIYNSVVVTKLINQIMVDGKRGTAQRIMVRCNGHRKGEDWKRSYGGL